MLLVAVWIGAFLESDMTLCFELKKKKICLSSNSILKNSFIEITLEFIQIKRSLIALFIISKIRHRCSISLAIRKLQVKARMKYYHTPILAPKRCKCWWGHGETGSLTCCWWQCRMVQPLWTVVWQLYIKLNIIYHINQHSHSWPFIPEKCKLKSIQKLRCPCSEQLYLYLFVLAEDRNNANVLQQVHGYTNYRTSLQWNTA